MWRHKLITWITKLLCHYIVIFTVYVCGKHKVNKKNDLSVNDWMAMKMRRNFCTLKCWLEMSILVRVRFCLVKLRSYFVSFWFCFVKFRIYFVKFRFCFVFVRIYFVKLQFYFDKVRIYFVNFRFYFNKVQIYFVKFRVCFNKICALTLQTP